jgi:hypothetical protein
MTELAKREHPGTNSSASAPVIGALLADLTVAQQKIEALAQAIPVDRYGWRPVEGVRSVAEVLKHVAANNYLLPAMAGAAVPPATGIEPDRMESVRAYEARTLSKEEAIAELRVSFRHLEQTMRTLDEARLSEPIQAFGHTMPALNLWVLTATHLHENLGQLIVYARSNRLVPSWSS